MTRELTVAQIEPVGGHGGMHYYDLGLARGLTGAGVRVLLFTSSLGELEDWPRRRFEASTPFAGSYGDAPRWLRGLRFARALSKSLRSARRRGADLVHLHSFGGDATERLALRGAHRSGLAIVVTVHDVASLAGGSSAAGGGSVVRGADALIVHNRTCRDEIAPAAADLPIEVVPHGHYLHAAERVARDAARRELGLDAAAPTALFFGQIKRTKGLDVLLDAMPSVVERCRGARLVIAGRAWKDDVGPYRERIRARGLEDAVELRHGFVADSEVPLLFGAADLVVLPYRRVYQSGVLLMAMSYGRAVLTSDLPAMRETVRDGENGFLFRDGDAAHLAGRLIDLLPRRELLDATAEAGLRQLAEHHDWGLVGERTADLYRRLVV